MTSLTALDRRLWSLAYDCLLRFRSPVAFKVMGPDVPLEIDQHIVFFVSKGGRHDPAVQHIRDELRHMVHVGHNDRELGYLWGTYVHVERFEGIEPYVEHEQLEEMAEAMLDHLMGRLGAGERHDA